MRAGWARAARPPGDSVVPLSDAEIAGIAGSYFVAPQDLALRAGRNETTIAKGTAMLPADTFIAAILKATLGRRPVHFMPGSSAVATLGLSGLTVREGLTWRIHDGPLPPGDDARFARLPPDELGGFAGARVDLPITDTLVWEVYLRRGRILDGRMPWADPASRSIPIQYAYTNYAAAQAHALRGEPDEARRHAERAAWWADVAGVAGE